MDEEVFRIPWEDGARELVPLDDASDTDAGLSPGPIGEYLEVIDYDPASRCFYAPVDVNSPLVST